MQKIELKLDRNDIFDYVVNNTTYDAIERCIDPSRYEVFDHGIYDNKLKKTLEQSEIYANYCKEVSKLRQNAKHMTYSEIQKICEEIVEIAPTEVFI